MTINIEWATTKKIFIPRADMPIVQASPEIRELDVNTFRLALKDLEASEEGIPWPDTHRHVTETTLSGSVYARLIEILAPYTIEFEDGQYSVRAIGANHNVLDVKINNQVSLAVQNSAGLINSPEIQFSSFENAITINSASPYSGTTYPVGTRRRPVNNITDALLIAVERGLDEFLVINNLTVSGVNVSTYTFRGLNHNIVLTLDASANVTSCNFRNLTLQGTMDGEAHIENCTIGTLSNVHGHITNCRLDGTITLSGAGDMHINNCHDGTPGVLIPIIDCGGAGSALLIMGYYGGIQLSNKTGMEDVSINGDSIRVILESTVTAGDIIVRGVGQLTDNSVGATVDSSGLVNPSTVADAVLDESLSQHITAGSLGKIIADINTDTTLSRKAHHNRLELDIPAQELILYDDNGTTPLRRWPVETKDGELVKTYKGVQTKRKVSLI